MRQRIEGKRQLLRRRWRGASQPLHGNVRPHVRAPPEGIASAPPASAAPLAPAASRTVGWTTAGAVAAAALGKAAAAMAARNVAPTAYLHASSHRADPAAAWPPRPPPARRRGTTSRWRKHRPTKSPPATAAVPGAWTADIVRSPAGGHGGARERVAAPRFD